jgi:undecaprenyl-diphosphatase
VRLTGRSTEVVFIVAGALLLVLSALAVGGENVSAAERAVFRAVNRLPEFLYRPAWVVMQLGNAIAVAIVALAAVAWRKYRLAAAFGLAGLSIYVLAKVVKLVITRPRPGALLAEVHLRGAHIGGNGYPSGHAAVAFALGVVAWLWFGPRLRWFFLALAAGVAFFRVYVGAHLPLDVVAGAGMGMIAGAVIGLALDVRRHGADDREHVAS